MPPQAMIQSFYVTKNLIVFFIIKQYYLLKKYFTNYIHIKIVKQALSKIQFKNSLDQTSLSLVSFALRHAKI